MYTIEMETVVTHVRLPEKEVEFIEDYVRKGYFSSKSSAIKTAIHLMEFSLLTRDLMDALKNKRLLSYEEAMKSLRASRKKVAARSRK